MIFRWKLPVGHYALERLALFVGKRHQRGRRYGLSVVAYLSPNRCGLVNLSGTVVTPRAGTTPWREKLNAGGERRR
jgi:RNA-directed DNA polymerase